MTEQRQILIGIRTDEEHFAEIDEVLRRIKLGLPQKEPVNRLYFFDMYSLTKSLSPKRMELLNFLRNEGPLNIRQLSKKLKRNYSNVHQDIAELESIGLVAATEHSRYCIPWNSIIMELAAAREPIAISA